MDSEATVITDGATRTYITSCTYNYIGQITSMTYPNGKVVTYPRDNLGRDIKVSSTIGSQNIDYVSSAAYLGPRGEVTRVDYGLL